MMKKIAFNILMLSLLAVGVTSCDPDMKDDVLHNAVYISEASTDNLSSVTLGEEGSVTSTTITLRLAQKVSHDVTVYLALDESKLKAYNDRNDTEYQMVPAEYVSFAKTATIAAGETMTILPIEFTSFKGESGIDYAAPISITDVNGPDVLSSSGSYIFAFDKVLQQPVPQFYYANSMSMDWDAPVDMPQLTLEWWARCVNPRGNGGFTVNNQALFSFQANVELYIRFGDVVYTVNGRNAYNFLQIKTLGIDANYDSGDPNVTPLEWGKWYHFAHTYDSSTGKVTLYVNGEERNSSSVAPGTVMTITGLNMICSGSTYFKDYVQMAQVRLWKTVRSASQISKNMYKEVKYTDPNLVFYLPMNEGSGSVLNDVTGNGHNVTIGSASNGSDPNVKSWQTYTFQP
jgi:hypothetical protein